MTCKDCFHYENICEMYDYQLIPCKHFKDKSRIIELPCKVGETVYEIHSHKLIDECFAYGDCYECNADPCPIEGRGHEKVYEIEERKLQSVCAIIYAMEEIGKTVFLTREEAEKALKGCEQHGSKQ